MKVKDILDYFGPQITCPIKFRHNGQDRYCFETNGTNFSEDEMFLNCYIVQVGLNNIDNNWFIEMVISNG